ncbi:MAG: hypothetical protein JWO50_36 [Candidatus Kaiserbacteria bacterium]|nr:hypothetical protein [Candidatus Kaiserbacteria bacterium]
MLKYVIAVTLLLYSSVNGFTAESLERHREFTNIVCLTQVSAEKFGAIVETDVLEEDAANDDPTPAECKKRTYVIVRKIEMQKIARQISTIFIFKFAARGKDTPDICSAEQDCILYFVFVEMKTLTHIRY